LKNILNELSMTPVLTLTYFNPFIYIT